MALDSHKDAPRPFDAKMVEHLVGMMEKHSLTEISLIEGDKKIRLRKGGLPVAHVAMPAAQVAMPMAAVPQAATPAPSTAPAAPTKEYAEIKSPMVGTFYSKPGPDKPDYVSIGSVVKADTVICKLEAMKIFNDLTADIAGTIKEVCIKNGEPVEFGTVLFRVDA